jgi:hypothetical protein
MRKSRFMEEQIVTAIQEHEPGIGRPHAEQLPPLIYEPDAKGKLKAVRTPTPDELPSGY